MGVMKRTAILISLVIGLLAGLAGAADSAWGDSHGREWEDEGHAYDRARRAVSRGEILPIAQLLEQLHTRFPGEVVAVELEDEDGREVYEFKIVDETGRLIEVYVNAATGEVLSVGAE
jgi:uncharacterized membrane protein YkoI